MRPTRRSWIAWLYPVALVAAALGLWRMHASAWGLGGRSPVLSFDPAQYALAADQLATHGTLATRFALPIELAAHARPPWPLAVVQPGLVLAEALVFRLVPARGSFASPARREWLALVVPLLCYVGLGLALFALARALLARTGARLGETSRDAIAAVVALAALLDPEAQHLATSGFTELPFTLGVVFAFALLASGAAGRRPFAFGLLLGVTGLFRGTMLAMLPAFAVAAAWPRREGGDRRAGGLLALVQVLAGWALPLAPWWWYKAHAFGSPGYDLSTLGLWDGAGGRTWFSLTHLPAWPVVPHGAAVAPLLFAKLGVALPPLVASLLRGPRALWIAALAFGAWRWRGPVRGAALALLAQVAVGVCVAAIGAGWQRYLFPVCVPLDAGGLLATLALVHGAPVAATGASARRVAAALVLAGVLGFGAWLHAAGLAEARDAAAGRGMPSVATLESLAARTAAVTQPGEVVMSNLGPTLAWYSGRPVLHLAETPAAMAACRERVEFRHVVVAFRGSAHAWSGWTTLVARPEDAIREPGWHVRGEQHWTTGDGFTIVWLDLGPAAEHS